MKFLYYPMMDLTDMFYENIPFFIAYLSGIYVTADNRLAYSRSASLFAREFSFIIAR